MNGSTNPYQTPESEGSLPVEELGEPTPGAAAIILLAIVLGTLLNHSVVFWAGDFWGDGTLISYLAFHSRFRFISP